MWKIKLKIKNAIGNFLHKNFGIHHWSTGYWHCTGRCSDGYFGGLFYRSRLCLICEKRENKLIDEKSWDFKEISINERK
jgi:hypothetical protein